MLKIWGVLSIFVHNSKGFCPGGFVLEGLGALQVLRNAVGVGGVSEFLEKTITNV